MITPSVPNELGFGVVEHGNCWLTWLGGYMFQSELKAVPQKIKNKKYTWGRQVKWTTSKLEVYIKWMNQAKQLYYAQGGRFGG